MKWNTSSWRKRTAILEKTVWHPWFAWHPVNIDGITIWLETVEKKGRMIGSGDMSVMQYTYRLRR